MPPAEPSCSVADAGECQEAKKLARGLARTAYHKRSLRDELDKIEGEYMIGGDFNAETEAFLRSRGKKELTLSDKMFNSMLTEVGRDLRAMANDATYRAGTQIDNWIVTEGWIDERSRTTHRQEALQSRS